MEQIIITRIAEIKADIAEYKALEKQLLASGGVMSYQLNSGQTTTQTSLISLDKVRSIIKDLQTELYELESTLNGGNFTILR